MSSSFKIPQTVAHQAPLSLGFHRQEYWSQLPFPSPGNFPDPRTEPKSPALGGRFFNTELPRKPTVEYYTVTKRNEFGTFVKAWMDLEIFMQSEVNQKEKK